MNFDKKSSVRGNKTDYVDIPYPKAVKMQPSKRLKREKKGKS